MKNVLFLFMLLVAAPIATAQTSILKISPAIQLPKDSVASSHLISSLNQFLIAAQADATTNKWVYQPQFLETTLLLDEIEGIQKREQKTDTVFYQPVLLDVSPLEDEQFFVQLSYIGTKDQTPEIRATIELIAHKLEDTYLFSSPLIRNTKNWKTTSIENFTFHYRDTINLEKSKEYITLRNFHDHNLNVQPKAVTFYLLEDGLRSQAYFGLPYQLDYNGEVGNMSWRVQLENQDIHLVHNSDLFNFDPHDLWHAQMRQIRSRRKVNHAVDEGIAYLYGGSWGFSWEEMFIAFQDEIKFDQHTDWLAFRAQKKAFVTNKRRNPTDFIINALFVQKIEQEKGFSAVMELLDAKAEAAYFEKLEQLTDITKDNYNQAVWKLIEQELEELKS